MKCGELLGAADLIWEQAVVWGFPLALWLSVAQAGLAGDDALTARRLKSDVKVHLLSQSLTQFQENLFNRGVRRTELGEQLVPNGV